MSLTVHRPESPLVSPRAAQVKLEPDPAVPTRPTWYLPLEIVEHIYEVAVEDALNDRDKAQALVYASLNKTFQARTTPKIYKHIYIGDGENALSPTQTWKLARLLRRKQALADHVLCLDLVYVFKLSAGMKQCISHLLAQVTPSEVHLDLAGSLSMVLSRIRATRLAGLYIQRFDLRAGSSQLDQLSLLLSRGSERLADLRFPALMLAEHANFDAELIPHCPELRGIWCTPAMDLTRYVPYDEHHLYDMSYFEILLQSHSEMLEAIDIGPILFLHMDQLSDLAFLPSAIVVDLDNFRTEPARSATLEDTYEYKQLQDLELACPGLCRLNFRSFYRVTPPQQLDAMVACISCLKDPNWLQFLMDIELEDFASMIDDAKIEMVVRTCRNVYEELKAVCKERKVDLSGGFVDLMEGRQ